NRSHTVSMSVVYPYFLLQIGFSSLRSVKYLEHVLDLWDLDWYKAHRIQRLEIAYVAESHQGDKLKFYREQDDNGDYCVRITKGDETEACRCKVKFVE
ncbi:MAG: hypothetical protein IIT85_01655, partial [Prevotella sp.]|nr:hypothetical protein [Prevotella sp.]